MKKALRIVALALAAVMLAVTLVSCGGPNADPDKAIEALKKNGYAAAKDSTIVPIALGLLGVDDFDCVVAGTKIADDKVDAITIVYFEKADDANDAWETVKKFGEEKKDAKASDWKVEKSGKMIYFGTSSAIKSAK